jgi:hypothetical protein
MSLRRATTALELSWANVAKLKLPGRPANVNSGV